LKKILFFTCEPGGAEVLIPVIKRMFKDEDFTIIVTGYGLAVDRFKKQNIDFEVIEPIGKDDFSVIEKYKPEYIITSATSLPQKDMSEKYLWHNAKQRSIPTIAFLDQWQNYSIRFSGANENEKLIYQPDFINCINDVGKKEMISEGFDVNKLIEFGQPYLSILKDSIIDKRLLINKLNLEKKKKIVLFVSEAIKEHYGTTRGYTQYETIDYLLKNKEFLKDKQTIVKLHPKDDIEKFKNYENVILIQNQYSSLEMISISDYVMGMTSIMLIEAFILEKKVLSVQLNLQDDLLLLSKEGIINKITNKTDNIEEGCFIRNGSFNYKFDYLKFKKYIV